MGQTSPHKAPHGAAKSEQRHCGPVSHSDGISELLQHFRSVRIPRNVECALCSPTPYHIILAPTSSGCKANLRGSSLPPFSVGPYRIGRIRTSLGFDVAQK